MRGKLVSVKLQRAKYVALDWVAGVTGFLLFTFIRYVLFGYGRHGQSFESYLDSPKIIMELLFVPVAMLGIYWLSGYYNRPFGKSRLTELITTILSSLLNTVWIFLVMLINDQLYGRTISYELILFLFLCLFIPTYLFRLIVTQNAISRFREHKWGFNTVIAGDSDVALEVMERLQRSQANLGYNVLAFLPLQGEKSSLRSHNTITSAQLDAMAKGGRLDQIIIAAEPSDDKKLLMLLYDFLPLGVPIRIAPTDLSLLSNNIRMEDVYAEPFVDLTSASVSESTKNVKRMIDVVLSGLALLLLSPMLGAVALAVKLTSRGPVIYSQERIGYHQKPFKIYKFRSMVADAEKNGPQLSNDYDPRVTTVGRFMRKYRIDELPQFWNVLKGDMSLVGPRPERRHFISQIVKEAPYYTLVHQVRPGITSWGMVKYGYASTLPQMVARTRYDLLYLQNMSLSMDMKIIIHTINTVFSGKGV